MERASPCEAVAGNMIVGTHSTGFGEVILGLAGGMDARVLPSWPAWRWVVLALAAVLALRVAIFLWHLFIFLWHGKTWERFHETRITPPLRIHLVPAVDTTWTTEPASLALSDQLRGLGFVEVGVFEIPEMPQAKLHGFVHEPTAVAASIYKLKYRVWADMGSYYEDGSSITYSTADVGEKLPRPPAQRAIRFPEMTLAALHQRLVQDRPRGKLRRVSREEFVNLSEGAHAAYQDWMAERGGYTIEELRTLIAAPEKPTAEGLQYLREKVAREALINWWRTQPDVPFPAEELNDCAAIVHEDLSIEQILFMFCRVTGDWGAKEKHIPPGVHSRRGAFEALNEVRKRDLVKFWEKTTPLCADFYCRKQDDEDD